MAELVDWLHHESITKAETTGYARQDHHLPHGSLEPHITNADRIRMMTDEELAEWITHPKQPLYCCFEFGNCGDDCSECALKWLKKEVKDG